MNRIWILCITAGLLCGVALLYRQQGHRKLQHASGVGALAPEFALTAVDGTQLTLADYRGKVVLLDFWATWCGPCRQEIPRFIQLQNQYGKYGFQILGISMDDSVEPVRQFYRDFHMNYPVALGDAKLAELYGGVFGLPIALLLDRQGRILFKHVGATELAVLEREIADAVQLPATARQ